MLIIPIETDNPMERRPTANKVIIGLNAILFILSIPVLYGLPPLGPFPSEKMYEVLTLDPTAITGVSLIGHQFLHAGLFHLVGNMLFLWVFGNNINARMGHWRYVVCYLAMGVAAGLAHCAFDDARAVGASGAICGITAMYVIWYPRYQVRLFWLFWIFIFIRTGTFWVSSIWVILVWFLFDLVGAVFSGGGSVAYGAHIGGYLAGIVAAFGLLLFKVIKQDGDELFMGKQAVTRTEGPAASDWESTESILREALSAQDTVQMLVEYRRYLVALDPKPLPLSLEKKAIQELVRAQHYDDAILALEQLVVRHPNAPDQPSWKYNAAVLYATEANDPNKAITLLERIVIEHPGWAHLDRARRDLERLNKRR